MDRKFQILSGLLKAYEADDGKPRLKTTASSTVQDHGRDRMFLSAIEQMAASAKENMTIFLNHSYEVPEDVLGSVEDVEIRQAGTGPDGIIYDLDFDVRVNETNPRAMSTWAAIRSGVKLGTSIGAIVRDWDKNSDGGWDIKAVDLMEASIVGIPANPRSWVHYAVKSLEAADPETITVITASTGASTTSDSSSITFKALCPECDHPEDECGADCACQKETTPELVKEQPGEASNEPTLEASAQEAEISAPEAAPQADAPEQEATIVAAVEPDTLKIAEHIETLVSRIKSLLGEVEEEREIRLELQERLDEADANLMVAKQIIERIADLPLPRKARMQAVAEFNSRVSGVYGEDFLKMLENE